MQQLLSKISRRDRQVIRWILIVGCAGFAVQAAISSDFLLLTGNVCALLVLSRRWY